MRNNEFKLHIWRSDILTSLFDNNFSAELVENMKVRAEIHGPEPANICQTRTTKICEIQTEPGPTNFAGPIWTDSGGP